MFFSVRATITTKDLVCIWPISRLYFRVYKQAKTMLLRSPFVWLAGIQKLAGKRLTFHRRTASVAK